MRMHAEQERASLALAVDFGQAVPVALAPLRRLLTALEADTPELVGELAKRQAPAWNRLFPGTYGGVPDLSDVALSPSERRLHRESEQIFRVVNLAAEIICRSLRSSGKTLRLLRVGAADLVSLRAVMRAQEWARLEGAPLPIELEGWDATQRHRAERFDPRRARFIAALCDRLRVPAPVAAPHRPVEDAGQPLESEPEARFFALMLDEREPAERRVAAAVRAIRACFFTTNYEGAMLAAERGLQLLDRHPDVAVGAVLDAWRAFGAEAETAAIEIEPEDVQSMADLRALFHRGEGVVLSFCGENEAALDAFARGLALDVGPLQRGHLQMFRALSRIKRMGQLVEAREEGLAGLKALGEENTERRRLHEAWLRNVVALTWFQDKNLEAAVGEEMQAIRCVSDQHSASATHLRINLITNLSSIQEAAKKFDQAIATWRKFEKMISAWDDNFFKHHRYRLAALQRAAGQLAEAKGAYEEAYDSATRLEDPFHQQVLASDLGHHALQAKDEPAARGWFEKASAHARAIGDPFHVGEGLAGAWLCGADVRAEAIRALEADSTWPKQSAQLKAALERGDRDAVVKAMTPPRTKLNRPFDLVNLY